MSGWRLVFSCTGPLCGGTGTFGSNRNYPSVWHSSGHSSPFTIASVCWAQIIHCGSILTHGKSKPMSFVICFFLLVPSSAARGQTHGGQHRGLLHRPAAGLPLPGQPGESRPHTLTHSPGPQPLIGGRHYSACSSPSSSHPQINVTTVREHLPKGDFSIMTEMLKKFLSFMNLTVSITTEQCVICDGAFLSSSTFSINSF